MHDELVVGDARLDSIGWILSQKTVSIKARERALQIVLRISGLVPVDRLGLIADIYCSRGSSVNRH